MLKINKKSPYGKGEYKKWYDDNRENVCAARRKRYHEDKAYRERVLERKRSKAPAAPEGYLTMAQLSEEAQVSTQTLLKWHKDGVLPETLRISRRRYYSPNQVALVCRVAALSRPPIKTLSLTDELKVIHAEWNS